MNRNGSQRWFIILGLFGGMVSGALSLEDDALRRLFTVKLPGIPWHVLLIAIAVAAPPIAFALKSAAKSNAERLIAKALKLADTMAKEEPRSRVGYLEVAGRDVYLSRLTCGIGALLGGMLWLVLAPLPSSVYISGALAVIAIVSIADAAVTWLRVRMHLYCGDAAEAAEVARFWRVEGRTPPPGGRPFEHDQLQPELARGAEGVGE